MFTNTCPSAPTKNNTYAVIVTYHPDSQIGERILLISYQVKKIIVIDNGSTKEEIKLLQNLSQEINNFCLILNGENLGISKSLNNGASIAINDNVDWMLTLDQDSCVTEDMLKKMSLTYDEYYEKEKIGIIAPTYCPLPIDNNSVTNANLLTTNIEELKVLGKSYENKKLVLTSGSLVNTKVFYIVGFYDEDLFVDYVDFEFCIRLHTFRYDIIQSNIAFLYHQVGFPVIHNFLGLQVIVRNHNKTRKYYIAKNRLLTCRKVLRLDFFIIKWVIIDLIKSFIHLLMIILFESERKEKVLHYIKGLVDGALAKIPYKY